MRNPFRRFRDAINRHPFSPAAVDAFLADGRGTVPLPTAPATVREATPIYDHLVAEKLAESRQAMGHLYTTQHLAGLVEDGKADPDLYEDLLDALVATPDQVWDMFDTITEADK